MKKITQCLIYLCICNCINAQILPLQISPNFSSNLTFLQVLESEPNTKNSEVRQIIEDLTFSIDKAQEHGEIRDSMFLVSNFIRLETFAQKEEELQNVLPKTLIKKANQISPGQNIEAVLSRMQFYEKHFPH